MWHDDPRDRIILIDGIIIEEKNTMAQKRKEAICKVYAENNGRDGYVFYFYHLVIFIIHFVII